jgi:predicted Zn-dependent protease
MTLSPVIENALPSDQSQKDYIDDFLRELVGHEVGHTLGCATTSRG